MELAELSELDFKNCLANPYYPLDKEGYREDIKNKGVFKKYPEFLEGIPDHYSKEKILTYLVCAYDKFSPFQGISNYEVKKTKSALYAGFSKDRDNPKLFNKKWQKILDCDTKWFVELVIYYSRIQNEPRWGDLIILREIREQLQKEILFRGKDNDADGKVIDSKKLVETTNRIEETIDKMVYDDNARIKHHIYRVSGFDLKNLPILRPEYIAKMQKEAEERGEEFVL